MIQAIRRWWAGIPIGTRSVLFGAHQFAIHPVFVALAWCKLYGFPWDSRLWMCFIVHDLGYWGKPNMDGTEGKDHVRWGANFMWRQTRDLVWWRMCMCHSRYWAKAHDLPPSKLCYADKMAFVITPRWVYIPMVWLTGEWREYARLHAHETHAPQTLLGWHRASVEYVRNWVDEFVDGGTDTWTKEKPNDGEHTRIGA